MQLHPLLILAVGLAVVLAGIVLLRIHAFVALILAGAVVSLLTPGGQPLVRLADAFGQTTARIGIVIAMAAIIGHCLVDSGAARRIVDAILAVVGPGRLALALMASGFVLAVPVFFDTVFYLLLPLAQVVHKANGGNYLLLVLAIGTGASLTHSLVPPTPGPLAVATTLGVDIGQMMVIGLLACIPTAVAGYLLISLVSRCTKVDFGSLVCLATEDKGPNGRIPPLFVAMLPVALPVVLISSQSICKARGLANPVLGVVGEPNGAMCIAAGIALFVWYTYTRPGRLQAAERLEQTISGAASIILITAAGGAFGQMLTLAEVGSGINQLIGPYVIAGSGKIGLLMGGFLVASIFKVAQGSSTVSAITAASMLAPMIRDHPQVGLHPAYLACAIGFGAQCGNWMNDSGFWLFSRMTGLTEIQTLRTWTVSVSLMAVVGLLVVIVMALLVPIG